MSFEPVSEEEHIDYLSKKLAGTEAMLAMVLLQTGEIFINDEDFQEGVLSNKQIYIEREEQEGRFRFGVKDA